MINEVVWIEATPRNAATAAPQLVLLAGGGSDLPYRHPVDGRQFRAGVVRRPLFSARLGFDEMGWTGSTRPQTTVVSFSTADPALRAQLAALVWKDAPVTIDAGIEGIAPSRMLAGKVQDAEFTRAGMTLTIIDLAERLERPIATGRFSGAGGIEGAIEAKGRVKRRSWGYVFNVEGRLIDPAYSIFEFGDPSVPLTAWSALRDKGREGTFTVLGWQGTIAATFAALRAAVPVRGGGVVAPSIACARWWTDPSGPLTADFVGGAGTGGSMQPAAIADALSAAAGGPPVSDLPAANTLRDLLCGLHVGSDTETYAQAIDRIMLGVSLVWLPQPNGTILISPWSFSSFAPVLKGEFKGRSRTYPPHQRRRVGFQRNERIHSDGELAGILLEDLSNGDSPLSAADLLNSEQQWSDVQDAGGTRPANNATVGSTIGTDTRLPNGTVPNQAQLITSEGTAAAYAGQTAWGTYTGDTPTIYSQRVQYLDTTGLLSGLNRVADRRLTHLVRSDGVTDVTEQLIITSLGTSAAVTGQTRFATAPTISLRDLDVLDIEAAQSWLRNTNGDNVIAGSKVSKGTSATWNNKTVGPTLRSSGYMQFRVAQGASNRAIAGLYPNAGASASSENAAFAFYRSSEGGLLVYNSVPQSIGLNGYPTPVPGTVVFSLFWSDGTVRYYINGTLIHTVASAHTELTPAFKALDAGASADQMRCGPYDPRIEAAVRGLGFDGRLTPGLNNLDLVVDSATRFGAAETGANRTETRTAAAYLGQTAWGTLTVPTARLNNLTDAGAFNSLANVTNRTLGLLTDRAWTNLFRANGSTPIVDADAITALGTAAAITGQGTGATANSLTQLNATEGGKLSGIQTGADVTASAQIVIAPPPAQIIHRDWQGTAKSGQFPRTITPTVQRGGVSIRTDAAATYSITATGVTATINNTAGSTDKGRITVTAGAAGSISLTVTVSGVSYGPFVIPFSVKDDAPPNNQGAAGGSDSSLELVAGTGFSQMTSSGSGEAIFTAAIASGQSLVGTAPLTYLWSHSGSFEGENSLLAKWQYRLQGSATWIDFAAAIEGSDAIFSPGFSIGPGEPAEPVNEPGYGNFNQTKSGLAAGTYEARLVGAKSSSLGDAIYVSDGTATLSVS